MMNKVLIVLADMDIGGIERSAIPLLKEFLATGWNVTLRLFSDSGMLIDQIPLGVKVEIEQCMRNSERTRGCISSLLQTTGLRAVFTYAKRIYHRFGRITVHKRSTRDFDYVISYQDGLPTWYVAKMSGASKKIAFVHTDFLKAGYNSRIETQVYNKFYKIFFPSEGARRNFLTIVKIPKEKTEVLHNTIDIDHIRTLAKEKGFDDDYQGFHILTVGRLSHEKGVEKIIPLLSCLKRDGIEVKWYLIGDGPEKEHLIEMAYREGLSDKIVLLGKKENPYSYMAQCDLYVQPSNYESYCISLAEARVLGCAILACDFTGADEQLINGQTGIITGQKTEEIYPYLKKLIQDNHLRERIRGGSDKRTYIEHDDLKKMIYRLS